MPLIVYWIFLLIRLLSFLHFWSFYQPYNFTRCREDASASGSFCSLMPLFTITFLSTQQSLPFPITAPPIESYSQIPLPQFSLNHPAFLQSMPTLVMNFSTPAWGRTFFHSPNLGALPLLLHTPYTESIFFVFILQSFLPSRILISVSLALHLLFQPSATNHPGEYIQHTHLNLWKLFSVPLSNFTF